jgi:type IV pilus assembly protein PilA
MIMLLRQRLDENKGFTLIELLVVILIIGILAAIAIPSFLNQRQKGQDACAKSMARTMQTAAETFYIDNNTYVGATPTTLGTIESQITSSACGAGQAISVGAGSGAAGNCTGSAGADNYCVAATSAAGGAPGRKFIIDRNTAGKISRFCGASAGGSGATGNGGACASGTW